MIEQVATDSISGLVTAGSTAALSFLFGRLFERSSIQDQYYKKARTELKELPARMANMVNSPAANGFKIKQRKQITCLVDRYWRRNEKILEYFFS